MLFAHRIRTPPHDKSNSKSAFNDAFRKQKNQSPSQWLKSLTA